MAGCFLEQDMIAIVILKPPNGNRTFVFLMPQGFYVGCQVPIDASIVGNKDNIFAAGIQLQTLCTLKYY